MVGSKPTYLQYQRKLEELSFEQEITNLLKLIKLYYESYPDHEYIGRDEFIGFFEYQYSQSKNKELYLDLINRTYDLDVSDSLASDVLRNLIEKHTGNKIVQELLPLLSGERVGVLPTIQETIRQYEEVLLLQEEEESPFVEDELESLVEQCTSDGLAWRLRCLNDDLGPLPGNTLGHFFAVPDAGKTSFIHSEVSFFEGQLNDGENILWFN